MKNFKLLSEIIDKPISGEWGEEGGTIKVLRTTNFTNECKIDYTDVVQRNVDIKKVNSKKLLVGDIIIEKSGGSPSQPVGRVVFFDNSDIYLCNNFTSVLRPKKDIVYPKYLLYILYANHQYGLTGGYQNKTTGIINLQLVRYVNETKIPLPPLDQQKKIASILDAADAYRQKTKALISKYDELTQSLFLDMFGDPVKNEKGWEKVKLNEKLDKLVDVGSNGGNDWVSANINMKDEEDYALMIRTVNLNQSNFKTNLKYVSETTYNLFKKTKVFGGEIIMNKIGSAGQFWLMPNLDRPVSLGLNQLMMTFNELNTKFFFHYFSTSYGKKTIDSKLNGATTKSITKTAIRDLDILYPPLNIQNLFAEHLAIIEQQKAKAQESLEKADELFNSLLQRAFNGEFVEP
jgi:type I restriction enzyme S subunit